MTDGPASSTQTAHGSKTPSRSPSPWLALAFASLLVLSIPLGDSPPRWILLSAVTLAVATILVARTRDAEVNGADLGLLLLEIGPCEGD